MKGNNKVKYRVLESRSLKQLQVGDFVDDNLVTNIVRKRSGEWLIFFKSGKVLDATLFPHSVTEVTILRPLKKFRGFGTIESRVTFGSLRRR